MDNITGLAYGRVALGALAVASPGLAAKALLLDSKANPQLPFVLRIFGAREVALGALTLLASGAARRQLVQVGVAVDGADALAALTALANGSVSKPAGLLFATVAGGAIATGVTELQHA